MIEKIGNVSETGPELPSGKFSWTEYKLNLGKLAKVLVEMEGRIESIETGQEIKTQRELTPKLLKAVDKLYEEDPYLTALDDAEIWMLRLHNEPEKFTVAQALESLRKKHKE